MKLLTKLFPFFGGNGLQLMENINSNGISSAYIDAPFDKGKAILNAKGYHISSLEESAKLRIQENREKDDPYFLYNSHWVSEASLCIPKKGCYITKKSPILNNSREATRIDKEYKDFCLSNEQVQIALSDSIFIPNGIFRIPTKRFGEDDYMRYFFGNTAQEFGELLSSYNIENTSFEILQSFDRRDYSSDAPFIKQILFNRIEKQKKEVQKYYNLFCCESYLNEENSLVGVRKEKSENKN